MKKLLITSLVMTSLVGLPFAVYAESTPATDMATEHKEMKTEHDKMKAEHDQMKADHDQMKVDHDKMKDKASDKAED